MSDRSLAVFQAPGAVGAAYVEAAWLIERPADLQAGLGPDHAGAGGRVSQDRGVQHRQPIIRRGEDRCCLSVAGGRVRHPSSLYAKRWPEHPGGEADWIGAEVEHRATSLRGVHDPGIGRESFAVIGQH
jgi:hypothetical protein